MIRTIVILGALVSGCGLWQSPATALNQAAREASVPACDRGDQQRGRQDAAKTLSALRRDHRMNTHQQAF